MHWESREKKKSEMRMSLLFLSLRRWRRKEGRVYEPPLKNSTLCICSLESGQNRRVVFFFNVKMCVTLETLERIMDI